MPIAYAISHELDLVYARYWATVTLGDVVANFGTFLADPDYRPGRPELIDLSRVSRIDMDFSEARSLLATVNDQTAPAPVHTRTVIWAPTNASFGMARLYQTLASQADGIEVHVTRDEAEALGLLGLPHNSIAALLATGAFPERISSAL